MNVWMISLVVYLIQPFDSHTTASRINCTDLCSLLSQTMNHPYLFPEDAEWTEEFQELRDIRAQRHYPRAFDDEEEFLDALFWVV